MPKHVHGLNMSVGVKKLILNYIGTAITFERKIYIFLDSREMYFDYTRWVSKLESDLGNHFLTPIDV